MATTANPWLHRRVLDYAHQGGAREQPSSTLAAMRTALAAGASAIELDVHATADGHLVVCHDATVDRTTEGHGAIASMTLAQVQALDNAYWWVPGSVVDHDADPSAYVHRGRSPADPDYRIPTLHEVLEAFPGVFLNLDIKQTAPEVEPYEGRLADVLAAHGRHDDVIVASFLDHATDAFRAVCPDVPTSAGTNATIAFFGALREGTKVPPEVTLHAALQVPAQYAGVPLVSEAFVACAHDAGLAVHVWTIDDEAEIAALVDMGVDGVMTDRPSVCARVLADRGMAWSDAERREARA